MKSSQLPITPRFIALESHRRDQEWGGEGGVLCLLYLVILSFIQKYVWTTWPYAPGGGKQILRVVNQHSRESSSSHRFPLFLWGRRKNNLKTRVALRGCRGWQCLGGREGFSGGDDSKEKSSLGDLRADGIQAVGRGSTRVPR